MAVLLYVVNERTMCRLERILDLLEEHHAVVTGVLVKQMPPSNSTPPVVPACQAGPRLSPPVQPGEAAMKDEPVCGEGRP